MRKSPLLSSLIAALFLLVPPVYAVNYSGEGWLDWTSLEISGIPITMTRTIQLETAQARISTEPGFQSHLFEEWRDHTTTVSIPQVATALSSADANRLHASVNLFGSASAGATVERSADFTAMETGNLTISIDYSLRNIGVPSLQNGAQFLVADLRLANLVDPRGPVGSSDRKLLFDVSEDVNQTGTLRVTQSFQSGDPGTLTAFGQATAGSSVPVPDMLWPTLAGMIGIAFWAERRRRKGHFAQ